MLKKALLSTLLSLSTIATAQISLDLNLTIKNPITEINATGSVIVEEDNTVSVMFDELDSLVINLAADQADDMVSLKAQFFQKSDTDEFTAITEVLTVLVPSSCEQPAVITINEQSDTPENDGTLVLVITPTIVE